MYSILQRRNEGLREELTAFAQELIRTPSPSLGEAKVADLVEAKMRAIGYDKVIRDEAGNVVGILFGREADPTLLLNCHMDTVISGDERAWDSPPYSGKIENGRIHGRGAADCKGGLAAQVYAGALLKRSLLPLRGNLVVAATVAEENGRSIGVRALLDKTLPSLSMKPTFALLGEPTDLGLYYGHDGWIELEVVVAGANPFQVDDAANAIFNDLQTRQVGRDEPVESFSVRRPHTEEALGMRRATIRMDRRLSSSEDVQEVLGQIRHNATLVAQAGAGLAVEVKVRQENQMLYTGQSVVVKHVTHAWQTDPFHTLTQRAAQSLTAAGCELRAGKWRLGRLGMGTAGSVLTNEYKTPTIGYGPGHEELAHAINESVEIEKLGTAAYGTAAIAHSLIGIPVCGWTSDEI